MSALAPLFALAVAASGHLEDERADVRDKLEQERASYEALLEERKDVLGTLDLIERAFRDATARSVALEQGVRRLEARARQQAQSEAQARAAAAEARKVLGPKVVQLDRLFRKGQLARLVSAKDFASLVKQERALGRIAQADLQALAEVEAVESFARLEAARAQRLQASALVLGTTLQEAKTLLEGRRANWQELLASVTAESRQVSRVVKELEAEERHLTSLVGELTSADASEFRQRKGHLPFPAAQGLVEAGFGKVVNPRFNTVTVQKGLDIRAPLGTAVRAVASGTVVFSGWLKGYGNLVIVDHGAGYHSLYAHLAHALVEVGNQVEEEEDIAKVGDTGSLKGAFLYFEVRKRGEAVDPLPWLDPSQVP